MTNPPLKSSDGTLSKEVNHWIKLYIRNLVTFKSQKIQTIKRELKMEIKSMYIKLIVIQNKCKFELICLVCQHQARLPTTITWSLSLGRRWLPSYMKD